MNIRAPIAAALTLFSLAISAPAHARHAGDQIEIISNIAFYEIFRIGELQLVPAAILRDTRCSDLTVSFCLDDGRFDVAFVALDESDEPMVLSLGRETDVGVGTLTLVNVGAEPARRGARPLEDYALTVIFSPYE